MESGALRVLQGCRELAQGHEVESCRAPRNSEQGWGPSKGCSYCNTAHVAAYLHIERNSIVCLPHTRPVGSCTSVSQTAPSLAPDKHPGGPERCALLADSPASHLTPACHPVCRLALGPHSVQDVMHSPGGISPWERVTAARLTSQTLWPSTNTRARIARRQAVCHVCQCPR